MEGENGVAAIMICDRCSRLGKGEALGAIAVNTCLKSKEEATRSTFEVCPFCVASFMEWLETGKDSGAGEAPFTAPYVAPGDGFESTETESPSKQRPMISGTPDSHR